MYHKYIKRFFDIILSLCCIIVSSPILLVTALLVRIKLGSPVIFKQERPGYHNEIFTLYKFRSMTDAVDENGDLLPDKERLPRFGQMLRSTSLDELPEFFNILFGHMSFVGPRPLLKQYIDFYSARQKRRADVRPGLTGLAQVNGRNAISWEEKFEFVLSTPTTTTIYGLKNAPPSAPSPSADADALYASSSGCLKLRNTPRNTDIQFSRQRCPRRGGNV